MLPTRYASFFKRFVAYVIDGIIAKTIAAAIVIPLGLLTAGTGILAGLSLRNSDRFFYYGDFEEMFEALAASLSIAAVFFWIFVGAVISWLYFAVFESSPRQATPGKMMLGLFVTDIHGRRITFARALGRTLSKIPSKMLCWMGYIMALFTARNQALHDLIADTLVLEPDYPAPAIASPPATPPAGPAAPAPAGVSVPVEPGFSTLPTDDTLPRPEPETEQTLEKPDEQSSGEDKPEQEKK